MSIIDELDGLIANRIEELEVTQEQFDDYMQFINNPVMHQFVCYKGIKLKIKNA